MEIEVEIKSQIPNKEWLENKIKCIEGAHHLRQYKQLNHYWQRPTLEILRAAASKLSLLHNQEFIQLLANGEKPSMRTRCTYNNDATEQNTSELIIKYTIGNDSSENGVQRLECTIPIYLSITSLDDTLLNCGAIVQAKWNREGWLWSADGIEIQIGFSPGYGWIAEFEKRATCVEQAKEFESVIRNFMAKLEVTELGQEKLEKMFAYYNLNWKNYYLSQKVFDIDAIHDAKSK